MRLRTILENHPQLEKHTIILTIDDLRCFLSKLRKDCYTPERILSMDIEQRATDWISQSTKHNYRFYAVQDDPDNFARNDNWGSYTLWQCIACRSGNGSYEILKGSLTVFSH